MALCNKQKPRDRWVQVWNTESACREYIESIPSYYLFDIDIREKLVKVNFIAIHIDGTTDRPVQEQRVLYVMHVDLETYKLNLSYFEVIEMDKLDQVHLECWLLLRGASWKIIVRTLG